MKYQKLLDAIDKFAAITNQKTMYQPSINIEFQAQRDNFKRFFEHFSGGLKTILNAMEGEIKTLKSRKFGHETMQMLIKVYDDLLNIFKEIDEYKPYIAGAKLTHYVLDKPNSSIIENLDFLAKHHIKQTNIDIGSIKGLGHPSVRSLDAVINLATYLKRFMQENPEIKTPSVSTFPPGIKPNLEQVPAFFAGREEDTSV